VSGLGHRPWKQAPDDRHQTARVYIAAQRRGDQHGAESLSALRRHRIAPALRSDRHAEVALAPQGATSRTSGRKFRSSGTKTRSSVMSESGKPDEQILNEIDKLDEQIRDFRDQIRKETSEETRNARRNLLIACLVGLGIAMTGAVPDGIQALGIKFGTVNRIAFLVLLMIVIVYFVYSFVAYTAEDEWYLKPLQYKVENLTELRLKKLKQLSESQELLSDHRSRHNPRHAIAWFVFPLYRLLYKTNLYKKTGVPVRVIHRIDKALQFQKYGFAISVAGLSLLALLARILFGFPPLSN
jgi:hypothetical protein